MNNLKVKNKILLVDDAADIRKDLSLIIESFGFICLTAENGEKGIELIKRESPDVLLTDQQMDETDGFQVLEFALEFDPALPVIMFTGYGTVQMAVDAMKRGAFDFIQKPILPEFLEMVLSRAAEFRRIKKENILLHTISPEETTLVNVVGKSPAMQKIAKQVVKVAQSNVNVMIVGESGTGKELIARNIHHFSPREKKAFIPVDCVSLPESLLESELFGFEKGAFTGAVKSRPGVFELADQGTLFLDEITELNFQLQAKLLRVLQERQLRRIGSDQFVDVDVRIISATNRNPEQAVEEKELRDDLYYRLNVVPIQLPALRERREDIPLLVQHFIRKYSAFSPIEFTDITPKALKCFQNYSWPGNIRELENIVQRIISMADEPVIQKDNLPAELLNAQANNDHKIDLEVSYKEAKVKYLQNFEAVYMKKLLSKFDGNISLAAQKARMSRQTLHRMLKTHGMPTI